jgi:valyl-tRNA synthetase
MKDLIDKEAEAARLEKETTQAASEHTRGESKLANEQIEGRAPPAVVDGERQRVAELRDALAQLQAQLERIRTL